MASLMIGYCGRVPCIGRYAASMDAMRGTPARCDGIARWMGSIWCVVRGPPRRLEPMRNGKARQLARRRWRAGRPVQVVYTAPHGDPRIGVFSRPLARDVAIATQLTFALVRYESAAHVVRSRRHAPFPRLRMAHARRLSLSRNNFMSRSPHCRGRVTSMQLRGCMLVPSTWPIHGTATCRHVRCRASSCARESQPRRYPNASGVAGVRIRIGLRCGAHRLSDARITATAAAMGSAGRIRGARRRSGTGRRAAARGVPAVLGSPRGSAPDRCTAAVCRSGASRGVGPCVMI